MASETFRLSFTPRNGATLDLAAQLVSHNQSWPIRFATHVYVKRDGGEQEPMGAGIGMASYRLCLVGPGWGNKYRELVTAIRREARGQLVDPLVGSLQAVCTGIGDASRDLSREGNAVNVSIAFAEDKVDQAVATDRTDTVQTALGRVAPRRKAAQTEMARSFPGVSMASVLNAVDTYTALVREVMAGAMATAIVMTRVAQSGNLALALGGIGAAVDVVVEGVLGSVTGAVGTRACAAVSRLTDLYVACVLTDQAVARQRPPLRQYTVSTTMSLFALAAMEYGGARAMQMVPVLLSLNRVTDPMSIPAGTVMQLPVSA